VCVCVCVCVCGVCVCVWCVCVCVCVFVQERKHNFYKAAFILRNNIHARIYDKQQLNVRHLQQTKTLIVVKDVEENEKNRENCLHHLTFRPIFISATERTTDSDSRYL